LRSVPPWNRTQQETSRGRNGPPPKTRQVYRRSHIQKSVGQDPGVGRPKNKPTGRPQGGFWGPGALLGKKKKIPTKSVTIGESRECAWPIVGKLLWRGWTSGWPTTNTHTHNPKKKNQTNRSPRAQLGSACAKHRGGRTMKKREGGSHATGGG